VAGSVRSLGGYGLMLRSRSVGLARWCSGGMVWLDLAIWSLGGYGLARSGGYRLMLGSHSVGLVWWWRGLAGSGGCGFFGFWSGLHGGPRVCHGLMKRAIRFAQLPTYRSSVLSQGGQQNSTMIGDDENYEFMGFGLLIFTPQKLKQDSHFSKGKGKKYKNATTTEFCHLHAAATEAGAPNKLVCNRIDGIFQVEKMVM
ncbi:hypothetical protein CMV_030391, partial [Castanea mollissima]